jgi:4-hydroxy-4-methyl-2-oxoglutarate aldolase
VVSQQERERQGVEIDDLFEVATVCDVSDSCDQLGVTCVRSGEIRPVYSECPPFTGVVATVLLEPGEGMPLRSLIEVFEETAYDAILIDLGGRTDVQCWGTVLATAARKHGVRAAMVNGATRDVGGLAEMEFPTFARSVHPAGVRGRLALTSTGCDVLIDGQAVSAGWTVVADENGTVFFPTKYADKVFGRAKEIAANEQRLLERLRSPNWSPSELDMMLT